MDENKIQQRRRDQEEAAAEKRAEILGLNYIDARSFEDTFPLAWDVFTIEQMYAGFLAPLEVGDEDSYKPCAEVKEKICRVW